MNIELNDIKVEVTPLDSEFVEWQLDKNCVKESENKFRKISKFMIEYIIRLQKPDINEEFPDDFPKILQYAEKRSALKSDANDGRKSLKNSLMEEAIKFIGQDQCVISDNRRRSTRFSGKYDVEKQSPVDENLVKNKRKVSNNSKCSSSKSSCVTSHKKKVSESTSSSFSSSSFSGSSSSSNDSSDSSKEQINKPQIQTKNLKNSHNSKEIHKSNLIKSLKSLSDSSSEDEIMPPVVVQKVIKPQSAITSEAKDQIKKLNINVKQLKFVIPKKENVQKVSKFKIPPVIDPPKFNPATKKKTKLTVTRKRKIDESLGGIFTVDNGWDQTSTTKKNLNVTNNIKKSKTESNDSISQDDVHEVHEMYQSLISSDQKTLDEKDSEENEEVYFKKPTLKKIKLSVFSSSDDESETESKQMEISNHSSLKIINSPNHINGNKNSETIASDDEDDAISLEADINDLDDFEDCNVVSPIKKGSKQLPSDFSYTSELDELKIKLTKESIVSREDAEAEFNRNTGLIMKNSTRKISEMTETVLNRFYGRICLRSLDNQCNFSPCKYSHFLPKLATIRQLFDSITLKEVDEAFSVALCYPKIFDAYVLAFTEVFVKKTSDYESRIARIIMMCERNPRSHQLYRYVVDGLATNGHLPRYKAIKFLLKHHTNSTFAQEAIMPMIFETGPDLIRLKDYLVKLFETRSLPIDIINKLLDNCNSYQDPHLPAFCLDTLITLNLDSFRKLKREHVNAFMKFQTYLTEQNQSREEKLIALLQRVNETHT